MSNMFLTFIKYQSVTHFLRRRKSFFQKKKSILTFIGGVAIVVFSIYLLSVRSDEPTLFENDALGITFEYPRSFGRPTVTINEEPALSGSKIEITFRRNKAFVMGGITDDYAINRDSIITDARGFTQKRGKYYIKGLSAKPDIAILPEEDKVNPLVLYNMSRTIEILFLDDESIEAEKKELSRPPLTIGEGHIAAVINLPESSYKGLAFWNLDTELLSPGEFEKLIRSIELLSDVQKPK